MVRTNVMRAGKKHGFCIYEMRTVEQSWDSRKECTSGPPVDARNGAGETRRAPLTIGASISRALPIQIRRHQGLIKPGEAALTVQTAKEVAHNEEIKADQSLHRLLVSHTHTYVSHRKACMKFIYIVTY